MDDPALMTDDQFADWLASRKDAMTVGLNEAQISELSDDALEGEVAIICDRKLREGSATDFAAVPAGVRAFYATWLFEWAVAEGGVREFLFTHPEPHILEAVFEGYRYFELADHAAQFERALVPIAADQLADSGENSFDGGVSDNKFNALVVRHDDVRIAYVRRNAIEFTG